MIRAFIASVLIFRSYYGLIRRSVACKHELDTKNARIRSQKFRFPPFRPAQVSLRLKRSNVAGHPPSTQRPVARSHALRRPRAVPESVIPKNVLAKEIASILDDQQLTQTEAAYIMRDAPSQISLVVTGKLRGFSTERLIRMLARLGRDIDIVIRPARGKSGKVTVTRR